VVFPRLGQATFRVAVLEAYGRACSVTQEHSLPALESAHIRSFAQNGPHEVCNGLLLRADLHRLFDRGYVTVTEDLRFKVGSRLRDDFKNGRSYYPLDRAQLQVPAAAALRPQRGFLQWHNQHVFRG
jgi:putative restriction endonuclease